MNLYEYQGKRLLKDYGIPIPEGDIATTAAQAEEIGNRIGGERWMIKAQILSGGRGKGHLKGNALSSGVERADSITNIRRYATVMLGKTLITRQTGPEGARVDQVYVEQGMRTDGELSMAMVIDAKIKKLVLLYSKKGGSDIELVAARQPESIYRLEIEYGQGPSDGQLASLTENLDLRDGLAEKAKQVVNNMYRLFVERDASLVEINPLAVIGNELVALDAKVALDDNAMFRQQENGYLEEDGGRPGGRLRASRDGFNYFEMAGNIGCLASGAGLSMATIDVVKYFGGEPANFLDLPPDSKVSRSQSAIELVLSNPRVRSVMINIFGGGIMRCDTIADAILLINQKKAISLPLVVRLAGTNSALAIRRLQESMPQIIIAKNMAEAAEAAVKQARSPSSAESNAKPAKPWRKKLRDFLSAASEKQ